MKNKTRCLALWVADRLKLERKVRKGATNHKAVKIEGYRKRERREVCVNSAELVFMFALATPQLTELDEHFTHRCQEQIASPLTKSPIGVLEVL